MEPPADDAGTVRGDLIDFREGSFHAPVLGEGVQHNHFGAPRNPVSWPHQVGTIPAQAACFQDRAESARLASALTGGGSAVITQTAPVGVMVGLGGVGKTQLAARYARTLWRAGGLDVLVWITASSSESIVDGYAAAATDLIGTVPSDRVRAALAFLAWLEPKAGQSPCRWLVVLDDVSDPADLDGRWPPASPTGRVLVTTRRQEAALTTGRHHIPVGLYTSKESLAYLTHALPHAESAVELAALAQDLGHLPLALSQAAAYLTDTGTRAGEYRRLLADRTTTLRDAAPDTLPDGQHLTVAVTWSLSIDHADRLRPPGLARPLLQLAAFLDPNGIPDTVLESVPARTYLAHHRTSHTASPGPAGATAEPAQVSERDVGLALSALRRLSLIQHHPATPQTAVRVHRLVQRAVRDALSGARCDDAARAAADALAAAWPYVERDTSLAGLLRDNTAALASCAEDTLYRPRAHPVLYRAGRSLGKGGQVAAARDYHRRLVTATTERLGPDHPDTLTARYGLARWTGQCGDAVRAAALFSELLKDMVHVLGSDHPDTLGTRHNLAYSWGQAGDVARAAAAFAELLNDRTRVLGAHHPHTLDTRSNVARWRGEAGDAPGAAAAFTELLKDRTRILDPTTRTPSAPETTLPGGVSDMVQVLGPEHPSTLITRETLAEWQGEAGDPARAVAALTDVVQDMTRILGADHPRCIASRKSLAHWRERQNPGQKDCGPPRRGWKNLMIFMLPLV
ncbi:tetratricopeptide repeat protein [Streptomyces cinnabarinus]|uniref:Tetratricopeptide repeat protein n=1 Tax=Streptomyces cinnabarinus TaxID=67287 RepID=A0ABY7KQG6_9ACTN|nr:tetratricopeptide repeat protein [Streptomyces cinnabarinus]WAZ26820.1 tetratricopeptide repeat protein [Streptomyces cinnabarinus]